MAQTTLLALYEEIDDAAGALTKMQQEGGFDSQDLMVLSSTPFPDGVLEADKSPIRLPIIALVSAFIGIATGFILAGLTPTLYLIRTGGKPLMSAPAIGIISYEFMMLFALLFAFLGALYEMRLPSWRTKVYDERISEGYIGIAAHCSSETVARHASDLLKETNVHDIRTDYRDFD